MVSTDILPGAATLAPVRAPVPLYVALARAVGAYRRCVVSNNDWQHEHMRRILDMVARHFPSGSGLDTGPALSLERSTEERLVIERCDYHHMNNVGFYDGWSTHEVTILPSLAFGFRVKVSGRDRNDVKDHLADQFQDVLSALVDEFAEMLPQEAPA